jgi:hypothetical protein
LTSKDRGVLHHEQVVPSGKFSFVGSAEVTPRLLNLGAQLSQK